MRIGLQTATTMQCNLVTDIKMVREAGFDEIELQLPKMEKYFAVGFTLDDLKGVLNGFPVTMLDALYPFEAQDKESRARLCRDCERYSGWAQAIGCGAIQVVALNGLKGISWPEARSLYASALRELADIARPFGVALGVEPLVWSPFHSLEQCLEVIDATERNNVKFNVDTFHLWTDGTRWDDVSKLDPNVIMSIHVADTNPKAEMQWSDDDRTALPGDGVVPMAEAIRAIKATGFDGVWSVEMWSKIHYEWDPEILISDLKQRMDRLVAGTMTANN